MRSPGKSTDDTHLLAIMAATIAGSSRFTPSTHTRHETATIAVNIAEAILAELKERGYPVS